MSTHNTRQEFENTRDDFLKNLGGREAIGKMTWAQIAQLELFSGSSIGSGTIVLPEMYMPAGLRRKLASRTIILFPSDRPKTHALGLRNEWIGRAALSMWLPRRKRGRRTLSPPSWRGYMRLFLRLVAAAERKMSPDDWDYWPKFQEFRRESYRGITHGYSSITNLNLLLEVLEENAKSGVMFAPTLIETKFGDTGTEASYSDQPDKLERPKELPGGKFKPFSNVFVSKLIRICLWLQDNLADQFLDCWELAEKLPLDERYCEEVARKRLRRAQIELFAKFPWKDRDGNSITDLPFDIHQRKAASWDLSTKWPPKATALLPHSLRFCRYAMHLS